MENKLKVLELFAGSRSVGKVADKLGHEVFSSDINDFEGIDYACNILHFDYDKLPFKPDVIWASPPCTTYSVAAIYRHRPTGKPISPEAELGDAIVKKTLEIIKRLKPKHWFIENPRGMLRKQEFMAGLPRATVWYCRYGDSRAKPTDIWSNNIRSLLNPEGWQPRPECKNGNKQCHHQPSPRGSVTGTQGLKGNYNRSIIPEPLCLEILKSIL
jgi:site-specific DNA-cytosine methylase